MIQVESPGYPSMRSPLMGGRARSQGVRSYCAVDVAICTLGEVVACDAGAEGSVVLAV